MFSNRPSGRPEEPVEREVLFGAVANVHELCVTSHMRNDVGDLLPEWRALHRRVGSWSPFSDPDYQLAWCETFVSNGQERILAIRRTSDRQLLAVLPLFYAVEGRARRLVRGLYLFGAVREQLLHELPEILVDPTHMRSALAAAVSWLARNREWDWIELSLREDQPWAEPRWLTDAGLNPPIVLQKATIPLVILELPADGSLPPLKRNLRESLRRSRNRMKKLPGVWKVESAGPEDDQWDAALVDLLDLHRARARDGHTPKHPNVFDRTSQEAFLRTLANTPAEARPRIYRLIQDEVSVAALLTFRSGRRTWLSVSGLTPERWDISGVTTLQWAAVQDAVQAQDIAVVMSTGVDTAKLRWSEFVKMSHSFVIVNPQRRSRWLSQIYWLSSSQLYFGREIRRFTPNG